MKMATEVAADDGTGGSGADRILRCLRDAGEALTVPGIVESTGLHENAVRRNLKRLEATGDVHVQRNEPGPARRGRPALRYRAVGSRDTPYRELLPLLLALLAGAEVSRDDVHLAGYTHGRASAPPGDTRSATLASLTDMGFAPTDAPRPETPEGTDEFLLSQCPFADVVMRPGGRRLCALHHGLLAGVADAHGGRVENFAIVDPNVDHCRLVVRRWVEDGGDGGDRDAEDPAGA